MAITEAERVKLLIRIAELERELRRAQLHEEIAVTNARNEARAEVLERCAELSVTSTELGRDVAYYEGWLACQESYRVAIRALGDE